MHKKHSEIDLLTKDLGQNQLKVRDLKSAMNMLEMELADAKDSNRKVSNELVARTAENDQLIQMLEDFENKTTTYEQKEKQVEQLAKDSR